MTRGPKPLPKVQAAIDVGVPTRPTQLMGKAAALREWKRIVPVLQQRGLWQDTDVSLVVLWCEAQQDFADADAALQEHGAVIADSKGSLKSNPAARQKKASADTMVRILAELGLTPSAIARRQGAGAGFGEADPLADLVRRLNA